MLEQSKITDIAESYKRIYNNDIGEILINEIYDLIMTQKQEIDENRAVSQICEKLVETNGPLSYQFLSQNGIKTWRELIQLISCYIPLIENSEEGEIFNGIDEEKKIKTMANLIENALLLGKLFDTDLKTHIDELITLKTNERHKNTSNPKK